jgi:hypothetical protein
MFRYDVQRHMLHWNAEDGFHVQSVLVRLCEVLQLAMAHPKPHESLEEIGVRLERVQLAYHIGQCPGALMMPKESFEKYLRSEGCQISSIPIAGACDQPVDPASECWNYFVCPPTPDGRRLEQAIQMLTEKCREKASTPAVQKHQELLHYRGRHAVFQPRPPGVKDPKQCRFEGNSMRSLHFHEIHQGRSQPLAQVKLPEGKTQLKWRFDPGYPDRKP